MDQISEKKPILKIQKSTPDLTPGKETPLPECGTGYHGCRQCAFARKRPLSGYHPAERFRSKSIEIMDDEIGLMQFFGIVGGGNPDNLAA